MPLTGRTDAAAVEARMRALETDLRDIRDTFNRFTGNARWARGVAPQVTGLVVVRTEEKLQIDWTAVTMPDPRYYEVQIDRRPNFGTPVSRLTSDTFMDWTSGSGFTGFYFYVRVRAVSADRRPGPFSPKVESAAADSGRTVVPASGVLKLPKNCDAIVVGGNATTITDITGGWVGRCVTLFFLSTHTVVDSSLLRLAGNFTATVNSSLTLRWFGARGWVEVTRTGTL